MMNKLQKLLLTLLLVLTGMAAQAQRIDQVSGQVRDMDGNPIEGALVTEVDKNGRTIGSARTDGGGMFNLSIRNSAKNQIQFAAEGYENLRMDINRRMVKVMLQRQDATEMPEPGVAVDLGLNVKWADRNVGAAAPTETGCFYSWGEITEKEAYSWSDRTNFGDNIDDSEYDAAHTYWKKRWVMPNRAEIQELVERCAWVWIVRDGVPGYNVIGPNGNSIFLPAGGMRKGTETVGKGEQGNYWSGSFFESKPESAYALEFNHAIGRLYHGHSLRAYGMMIRPVWR